MFTTVSLALTNLLLSSDNVLVIAIFSEELGKKRVSILFWSMLTSTILQLGILYALSFLFRIRITQFLFGAIICYMAFRLLYKDEPKKDKRLNNQSVLASIWKITAGNLMMSFENEATLIGLSHGHIWLAWYAIIVTSPLIFFASDIIAWVLRKFDFVVYIGSVILFKIGLDMAFTLPSFRHYVPAAPWIMTGLFTIYVIGRYLHKHDIRKIHLH